MSIVPAGFSEASVAWTYKREPEAARKLPDEISFLADHVPLRALESAAAGAAELGVGADEILIAEGVIGERDFYARLAEHLGAELLAAPPEFDADADWRAALRTGVIRLRDGRWVLAPRAAATRALLSREGVAGQVTLATPTDFERAILTHYAADIADHAAENLASWRPDFCARSGAVAAQTWLAIGLIVLLPAELIEGLTLWAAVLLLLAGTMFVAVAVRISASLLALAPERAVPELRDADLPFYTALVALHREAEVASELVAAMRAIDYPQAKHEIIFLVEADDLATRAALEAAGAPRHMRIMIAPDGAPRTKPRALNIGLLVARGDLLVIYDAEDMPAPDQLRKAAARFRGGSPKLAVLQAVLRIDNARDSWLTRLFRIDYAAQFEVLLRGMGRLGLLLPLGGTSNHFRTDVLRAVGGWDAWNVTEDADLGLRLARLGYACETIASVTLEEAPPTLRDWYPQRRRWLKGWMQTFVTHTRDPIQLVRDLRPMNALHALALLASNTFGPAVGLWITLYVLHESFSGDFLASPAGTWRPVAWLWAGLAGFGVISIVLPTLIAMVRGRLWSCAPYLLLRPLHWICVSAAAFHALYDLWTSPHHWAKTRHGLARRRQPP